MRKTNGENSEKFNMYKQIHLPIFDISAQTDRHVFVARGTKTDFNGHPNTVLMPDGRTIFCVWQGRRDGSGKHGAPVGFMKRSDDGGRTWSNYIDLPANWREIGRGAPTIHRLVDGQGKPRLIVFCRDENRTTFLQAVSEDDGATWSELRPIGLTYPEDGPITGWTAPINILEAINQDGRRKHLMWYERDRDGGPRPGVIWQSASYDGGLTWGESKPVVDQAGASEPGCVRSPDGKQLLLLIREQNRELNSLMATSDDEGESWSEPRQLPLALTGDRHLAGYAPDGRLVVVFRPVPPGEAKSLGNFPDDYFMAWVGRYEDIVEEHKGDFLIRLLRNYKGADHTYPGLEVLPDGRFVATTYIKYRPGDELHSIVSVRFRLDEFENGGKTINVKPLTGDWGESRLILTAPEEWNYNHLAWPKIVKTVQNNLILACSAGIGHNMGGSGLAVSVSTDNGRSFSTPEMLRSFPQFDNRYHDCGNCALGIAGDDTVILLAMAFRKTENLNTIFGFRSEDEGKSWHPVDTGNLENNITGSVYGHIFQLPEGRLGVAGHYRAGSTPYEQGIWMSFSDDNGRSWSSAECITEGYYVEPAIIYNRDRFIGLLRTDNGRDFYTLAVSGDGDNWRFKPNAFDMEPRGEKYPSPFIIADPRNPNRLWALSSVRHEDITLYSADMNSTENLLELDWKRIGTVVKWGGPGDEYADWTYPWMCYQGDDKWMCVFYCGRKRGKCDIYGLEMEL